MPTRARANIGRRTRQARLQKVYLQNLSEEKQNIIREKARMTQRSDETTKFIKCYEQHRALWDSNYENFLNREEMQIGYAELLQILLQSNGNAKMKSVKRKISTIRSAYKREILKIRRSKSANVGNDLIYCPTLRYFNLLSFLKSNEKPVDDEQEVQEVLVESEPVMSDSAEEDSIDLDLVKEEPVVLETLMETHCDEIRDEEANKDTTNIEPTIESSDDEYDISHPAKRRSSTKTDEIFSKLNKIVNKEPDDCDILAKSWASKLRAMPTTQSRKLERFINHTLLKGEMQTLKETNMQ